MPSPRDRIEQHNAALPKGANAGISTGQAPLPHGWEMHIAQTGKVYYWNQQSDITQWEVPVLP